MCAVFESEHSYVDDVFVTCRCVSILWHVRTVYLPASYPCHHGGRGDVLLWTRSLLCCWPAGARSQKCCCSPSWTQVFLFILVYYRLTVLTGESWFLICRLLCRFWTPYCSFLTTFIICDRVHQLPTSSCRCVDFRTRIQKNVTSFIVDVITTLV